MAGGEIARLWATVGADVTEFLNKMDAVERRATDTGSKIERAMSFMGLGVSAASIMAAGRATYELAQMGAQADRLYGSFEALAGVDAAGMMGGLREASRGAIDDIALWEGANKAMMLGVTQDAEEMARLMEAAAARGKAMGLSTAQAFDRVVTGIGRRSPQILDDLGFVGAQKAVEDYAAATGRTANQLSELEQRQALVNKVLTDSSTAALMAKQGAADAATEFERIAASWKNVQTETGRGFAHESAGMVGTVANWLAGLAGQMRNTNEMRATYAELQAQVMDTAEQIRIGNIEGGNADFGQALLELDRLRGAMGDGIRTAEQMRGAWDKWLDLHPDLAAALGEVADQAERLADFQRLTAGLGGPGALWGITGPTSVTHAQIESILAPYRAVEAEVNKAQNRAAIAAMRQRESDKSEAQRESERAQREWERQQEQAASRMRSLVESVLSPTSVSMADLWHTERGDYGGRWDEYIRRLRSAVEDPASMWKEMLPADVLGGGMAAMQGYLEEQSAAFYSGQLTGLIDWGALDAQIQDMMAKQQAREALIGQVMARSGGGLGKAQAAGMLGLPYSPGEVITGDVVQGLANTDYGRPLTNALQEQIEAEQENLVKVGKTMGRYILQGASSAMTPAVGMQLARALWPYLAELMPQERP